MEQTGLQHLFSVAGNAVDEEMLWMRRGRKKGRKKVTCVTAWISTDCSMCRGQLMQYLRNPKGDDTDLEKKGRGNTAQP